ncbi:hypothetical protein KKB40_05365 [Patescibacteria group bacterium]|nr:hypothetical protein [Patescibacteria group bacterium]
MNKKVFVTLFDSNYLAKALVNYLSLEKYLDNFTLYAYCFDDLSYEVVNKLGLKNLKGLLFRNFENKELLEIKRQNKII